MGQREFHSKLLVHGTACLCMVPLLGYQMLKHLVAKLWLQILWYIMTCMLICSPFLFQNLLLIVFCTYHEFHYYTLPKTIKNVMRGSVLIQGLIGLYPKQLSEPWFAFVIRVRTAVVSNVRFACVLLPCLCCVIANKDALRIIVYMHLLQLFVFHFHYWLLSD